MTATLVLLPGMDGTGALFDGFVASMPAGIDVAVIRYPGHESADYPTLEDLVRDQLPKRPFVLLAESFSGPIGLSIAADPPAMLRGLILCCTFAKSPVPFGRWMRHIVRWAPAHKLPQRLLDLFLLGRYASADLRAKFAEVMASVSPQVMKQRVLQALQVDVSDRLCAISVPTMYLRASEDRLIRQSAANHLASEIPSMRTVQFDAPHFLLQTRSPEAAIVVAEFVRSCSGE
ncbi:MAG: alpha/beta fold hydrolase [Xanthomonadales bacterium]|nr:alpha/beta fold hydrolase [Xanthomonadales bacterium]